MLCPDSILGEELWWFPITVASNFPEDPAPEKLTKAQIREALLLFEKGYQVHFMSYRQMPRNRPLWRLVQLELAYFEFGPVGSWLKQQGFMPLWSDPVI